MAKGGGGGGPTVAKAYVAIIPTTKDAQKNISKSLIPDMEKASEEAGEQGGKSLVGKLGDALSAGMSKVAAAAKVAAGAGVAALGALTTAAYGAFSDWEQLSGGVKTIFGDAAAETVIANAKRAFGTVQMSANDYLNTVTSFSATLIQSLGGDANAAASMADMAISDMADNANKMGTSLESLQYAYSGFARGQFTMLDNLKLPYKGTQEEMLRLVHDAGVVDEAITDISEVRFDQMIEGIHIIQQRFGITGASAAEAATTLEGSFNMMSASWQNLLVAFGEGTPDAIKPAADNLIASVGTWLSNAIPRIGIIISGIVSYIPTLAQDIISALPGMVSDIATAFVEQVGTIDLGAMLKPVIDAAMENSLFASIVSSIMGLTGRIGEAFTQVFGEVDLAATFDTIRVAVETAMGVITQVITAAQDTLASFIGSIDTATIVSVMEGLKQIGEALIGVLATIGSTVADVLVGLVWPTIQNVWAFVAEHVLPGIMTLWEAIQPGIVMVIEMLGQVYDWISQIVGALVDVLAPAIQLILTVAGPIFDTIIAMLGMVLTTIFNVVSFAWNAIKPFVDRVVSDVSRGLGMVAGWINAVLPVVTSVIQKAKAAVETGIAIVRSLISSVVSTISRIISGIASTVIGIVSTITSTVSGGFNTILHGAYSIVSGIGNAFWGVVDAITSPFRSAFDAIKRLWNSTIGKMRFTVPDWVPIIGGAGFSMPRLASGGTIMQAGTVMVGEAGPEVLTLPRGARVAPLSASDATAGGTTYSVVVGDVNLSDDDEVRRITRDYLERLARLAQPGGVVMA